MGKKSYMRAPQIQRVICSLALSSIVCLISCHGSGKPKSQNEGMPLSINLKNATHVDEAEMFTPVTRFSKFPKPVLAYFPDGMADPDQPYSLGCIRAKGSPPSQLLAAAVSKQYFIVSHISGGIVVRFGMEIYRFSGDKAEVIWRGSGGDTRISGLKETIESDYLAKNSWPLTSGDHAVGKEKLRLADRGRP